MAKKGYVPHDVLSHGCQNTSMAAWQVSGNIASKWWAMVQENKMGVGLCGVGGLVSSYPEIFT